MPRARLRHAVPVELGVPSPGEVVGKRSGALERALVAAGAPGLLATYDMARGSHADRLFKQAVMESGLAHLDSAAWPHDGACFVTGVRGELFREGTEAFYRLPDGTLAHIAMQSGWVRVSVAAAALTTTTQALSMFQALYPPTYLSASEDRVPITFWMNGRYGPERRLRMIDASPWADIERNYTATVRDELGSVMAGFEPGKGGQLLLWQGPPGTGKTYALRALVSEWLSWAEFHYITDPDAFFVESASYMVGVLLSESYQEIDEPSGAIVEGDPQGKWRVLILEDTGELLSANAKEKYGQGLARLLNVVDGLIGQGLRVLVLVTTNDELGELNAAVRRPGRCASQIVFSPLTQDEAAEWLGDDVADGTTLAELYERAGTSADALPGEVKDELVAAGGETDVVSELQRVAADVAPEGGYGETGWDAANGAVFWVSADRSTSDEVQAARDAFLAIEGVESFEEDAEAGMPDGYEQVWPVPGSELAFERVLELARRPLAF